jgi:hypothetical protein
MGRWRTACKRWDHFAKISFLTIGTNKFSTLPIFSINKFADVQRTKLTCERLNVHTVLVIFCKQNLHIYIFNICWCLNFFIWFQSAKHSRKNTTHPLILQYILRHRGVGVYWANVIRTKKVTPYVWLGTTKVLWNRIILEPMSLLIIWNKLDKHLLRVCYSFETFICIWAVSSVAICIP